MRNYAETHCRKFRSWVWCIFVELVTIFFFLFLFYCCTCHQPDLRSMESWFSLWVEVNSSDPILTNPKEGLAQCHSHSLLKRSANNGGLLRGFVVVTTRNIWKSLILTHAIARPLHMLSVSLLPYNPRTFLPFFFFSLLFSFFLSFFLSLFFFSIAIRSIHLMDSSQDPHNIRLHTSHHH